MELDEQLEQTRIRVEEMEKKTEALFQELGISPHQLHHYLNDPANFTPEAFQELQRYQQAQEEHIQRSIEAATAGMKKRRKLASHELTGSSHWIFIR